VTAMVLLVRAPGADVERRAIWARSRVRIAPSSLPDWTLVDVGSADQAALERVAEEVTKEGPAVLLVVAEWRSAVQLWAKGRRRASVAWTSGAVNGLDETEATAVAAELGTWLGADPRALTLMLRSPASPDHGWRALTTALGVPVPPGFPYRGAGALDSDRARTLERRSLLEAAAEDGTGGPLPSSPDRTPEPSWKLIGRALLLVGFVAGIGWALAQDSPRVVTVVSLGLGCLALGIDIVRQLGLRRAARRDPAARRDRAA